MEITKQDVQNAFRNQKTRRRKLLFTFYHEWFLSPLTADVLAQKISQDLGFSIDANLIYHVRQTGKKMAINIRSPELPSPKEENQTLALFGQGKERFQLPALPEDRPLNGSLLSFSNPTK